MTTVVLITLVIHVDMTTISTGHTHAHCIMESTKFIAYCETLLQQCKQEVKMDE